MIDWISVLGRVLRLFVRTRPLAVPPKRVLLVKLCCIGDVILTTPLLACLRRAWPEASVDWLVDAWAIEAIQSHPALDRAIEAGSGLRALAKQMAGYDLLVVPDRSPMLSAAALYSRAPCRAGLDSVGRGFGYTIRAPVDPEAVLHEAEIYLDVARAMNLDTYGCRVSFEPSDAQAQRVAHKLDLSRPYAIIHPGGGDNPGMAMPLKRWPAKHYAALAERCVTHLGLRVMVLGGPHDGPVTAEVLRAMRVPAIDLTGQFNLGEVGALARRAALYVGNDTGLSHLAVAAGTRTLMIFGPSDPRRYGPFGDPARARYVWREIDVPGGVNAGLPSGFAWDRDGVSVEEVWEAVKGLLGEG